MAASMRVSQLLGHSTARALAIAARVPLALTVLALAFAVEAFARRVFRSAHAGLYAALILLSSFGTFVFTRILLPDAMLCLWLALAMLCFWRTEELNPIANRVPDLSRPLLRDGRDARKIRLLSYAFAACCALGVLTKGFIGAVFPITIVVIYLWLTRGLGDAIHRILQLHPFTSTLLFLAIAAPWHLLAAWANPTRGHPGDLSFTLHSAQHLSVPLPTDGNVHGWAWFYFINEQLLRYLNLRVPRDYDTVSLWLFWGLCLIWLMPWSAYVFKAIGTAFPVRLPDWRQRLRTFSLDGHERGLLLLVIWAVLPLFFFSFSTRQEYYVLPSLQALAILVAGWLAQDSPVAWSAVTKRAGRARRAVLRCTAALLALGTVFAAVSSFFLLHTHTPAPATDLATLLQQNPGDYALSMGHFLDLNEQALGLFRLPLALAAASLFLGPLISFVLRRHARQHAATLALTAGAFGFLLAAHLGLQTFAPVLSSQQLAAAIVPQLRADDLLIIHQEYEYGSTLGFYLQRPSYGIEDGRTVAINPIHILTEPVYNGLPDYGRSSNLWYGSFFPDAPAIFETPQSLAWKWRGPQHIFLWQDLSGQPSPLPALSGPVYIIAKSGGKEIVSNQPNR